MATGRAEVGWEALAHIALPELLEGVRGDVGPEQALDRRLLDGLDLAEVEARGRRSRSACCGRASWTTPTCSRPG